MELLEQAGRGDLDGVRTLIQRGVSVNTTTSRCNQTALYRACERGRTEVAQYLLDQGASVSLGAKPLIAAVRHNHYDCVKLLLQRHANVNCFNTKRESPMSIALQKRHYSIILLLLQYDAISSESLNDVAVQLLKHAQVEHAGTVEKLIDKNLLNLTSENIFLAAFSFAFKRGSVELAGRMLSNDSYSKIEQLYPDAAYYSAKNNWPTVLARLFEKRFDINALTDGETPLYAACKQGHETIVTLLLNSGADPNVPSKLVASKDLSLPFQIAVQRGNVVICTMLLEKGARLVQAGEPLLHIACSGADEWKTREATETRSVEHILLVIKLLLQHGVNVNAISEKGETALYRACTSQQPDIARVLLEAGADVNLTSNRRYPLIAACDAGNVELINLLMKSGADVKCSNSSNETCLHAVINGYTYTIRSQESADSVSKTDITNVIKTLVEVGVDINARCSGEETALYRSSKAGYEDMVKLLLEAGAETDCSRHHRPLHAACEYGNMQIVDLLLQHGADPNASSTSYWLSFPGMTIHVASSGSLPICCAVKKGHTDVVELMLKHGADVNKQDESGKSALIYVIEFLASQRCKTPQVLTPLTEETAHNILKSMLLAGGDVNMPSKNDGLSPLHIASSSGMCDIMMQLIQHGANCNQPIARSGKSALDLACENNHEAAVELLLKNGAKPDEETVTSPSDRRGRSSYESYHKSMPVLCTAAKDGRETMVKMLLNHGANVNASGEKGNTALHLATSNTVIDTLLNAGANVNAKNDNGETVLSVVCAKQQADANVVEQLLKFGADANTGFPLHAACKNNDPDIVKLLLAYGADANLVKESISERRLGPIFFGLYWMAPSPMPMKEIEPSPLCTACRNGNVTIVDCLLKNGASTAFADSDGNTALDFAVERSAKQVNSEEYDQIITLLLQHNAPVNVVSNRGETPLYVACMRGLAGVVKQLLDCRADVSLTTSNSHKYPLFIACERKFRDIAMLLLDRGANANVTKDEQTPLKLASANGDAVLVKALLSHGADVNKMQNISDTALHCAVNQHRVLSTKGFVNVVQRLLKSSAKPNVLNDKGETPLYLACSSTDDKDNLDIVQTLLEHGADPNICPPNTDSSSWYMYYDVDDILPPLSAAARCGNDALVSLLIKFGAKVDHRTTLGRTALHYAMDYDDRFKRRLESSKNYMSAAEILLSAGADFNVKDRTGASPLYLACNRGKTELVKLLLSSGASPNIETLNKSPIHAACSCGHYDSVKLLLEYKADVTVCDKNGKTALHCAVECEAHHTSDSDKRSSLVHLLLDVGANVNAASENGETPFYIACSKGLLSVARKMLECGAKVDGNSNKKLPLTVVCRNKHMSVVQLLLINGANPNVQAVEDYRQMLPLHIAAADSNTELVELLLKHGANVDIGDANGRTALHYGFETYHPRATMSGYSDKGGTMNNAKSVLDILLENKADVNIVDSSGETSLYKAASRGLLDVVSKMLQMYGGNPNKGSPDKRPLAVACERRNVELVDVLLKHAADPNLATTSLDTDAKYRLPLCIAVKEDNCDEIIILLLKSGASVNAINQEGKSALCIAVENMRNYHSNEQSTKRLSTIRLLLEHGADSNVLMPDGRRSLLFTVVTSIADGSNRCQTPRVELLQLMVKHGAILSDSLSQIGEDTSPQSLVMWSLATFDGKHEFIADLFQAGATMELIALCCNTVATSSREAKSLCLCQAAVLAGYTPSAAELQQLQLAAEYKPGGLLEQLVNWLNEDRQQVPSLLRQSRVAIRRQLSVAVHYQTILPAIDKLPLPNGMKSYLQFEGTMTEVDLSITKELQAHEISEELSTENRRQLTSPQHSENSDYYPSDFEDYFGYDFCNSSDNDYYCYGSDSDEHYWW